MDSGHAIPPELRGHRGRAKCASRPLGPAYLQSVSLWSALRSSSSLDTDIAHS